jgi:hypothetical protein
MESNKPYVFYSLYDTNGTSRLKQSALKFILSDCFKLL